MSEADDPYLTLMAQLQNEAHANISRALDFVGRPLTSQEIDEIIDPQPNLEEYPSLRQLMARELLRLESERKIGFNEFVRRQIEETRQRGTMTIRNSTTSAREETLSTMLALALRQSVEPGRQVSFFVLSLFRARGGNSPHDHGLGIDVTRYNDYNFRGPTQESFNGLLNLVRNLPRGIFELGLPRVPRETWHDYERYRRFRIEGEYLFRQDRNTPEFAPRFRAPGPPASRLPSQAWAGPRESLNPDLEIRRSPSRRGLRQDLDFFENRGQANLFRQAESESEGTIRLLFPDEPNHVHITVDINNSWTNIRSARRGHR